MNRVHHDSCSSTTTTSYSYSPTGTCITGARHQPSLTTNVMNLVEPDSTLGEGSGPLGRLLNDIQPHAGPYLPVPHYANASWGYDMETDEVRGRLHIQVRNEIDVQSDMPHVILSLTVRGKPTASDITGVLKFLDCSREWIVRGFYDITTPSIHKSWGYRQREALT